VSDSLRTRIAGLAVAIGLALGLWGALAQDPFADWGGADGIAVTVNDAVITTDDLTLAIEAVASDKRNEMTQADRDRILSRLIDEELLIQRGIEVGLVDSDNTVRKAIVNAMINSILADASLAEPSESDLRSLYAESPALFSGAGRYQVEQIFIRSGELQSERLQQVSDALAAGLGFTVVNASFSDPVTIAVPEVALPASKLREYTGPSALQAIMGLSRGEHTGPIPVPGGKAYFLLVDLVPGTPRPFEQVRGLVAAEYTRRRDDAALRSYLDWLWSRGEIATTEGYTAAPDVYPDTDS